MQETLKFIQIEEKANKNSKLINTKFAGFKRQTFRCKSFSPLASAGGPPCSLFRSSPVASITPVPNCIAQTYLMVIRMLPLVEKFLQEMHEECCNFSKTFISSDFYVVQDVFLFPSKHSGKGLWDSPERKNRCRGTNV